MFLYWVFFKTTKFGAYFWPHLISDLEKGKWMNITSNHHPSYPRHGSCSSTSWEGWQRLGGWPRQNAFPVDSGRTVRNFYAEGQKLFKKIHHILPTHLMKKHVVDTMSCHDDLTFSHTCNIKGVCIVYSIYSILMTTLASPFRAYPFPDEDFIHRVFFWTAAKLPYPLFDCPKIYFLCR